MKTVLLVMALVFTLGFVVYAEETTPVFGLVDLVTVAQAYGAHGDIAATETTPFEPASEKWNPKYDFDNNNQIGLGDLVYMANHWHK
jgi:hypothetical protein